MVLACVCAFLRVDLARSRSLAASSLPSTYVDTERPLAGVQCPPPASQRFAIPGIIRNRHRVPRQEIHLAVNPADGVRRSTNDETERVITGGVDYSYGVLEPIL
jgi:hypothetical protein